MSAFTGRLLCPRCRSETPESSVFSGCPVCASEGIPINVHPEFNPDAEATEDLTAPGIFRYRSLLPIPDDAIPISLEEGRTPLLPLTQLTDSVGLERLYLKDESRNPTWSYKDRLAAVAVTRAKADGADTVVVGTTGNHGAAAAAYAAAALLRCVVLTLPSVPDTMKTLMQVYGAKVVAVPRPEDRWTVMRQAVDKYHWTPMSGLTSPPVGSNPYGIEGYKTIAYELADQLGGIPDFVVVPVAYGDGLIGIHRGFKELKSRGRASRVPRLVAVEPVGPLAASLDSEQGIPLSVTGRPSVAFSIAGTVATMQGIRAIQESGGRAVVVPDDSVILRAQRRLASAGFFLEPSAAICLPAVELLRSEGFIPPDSVVVMIGTSGGLKDVEVTAGTLPPVPLIEPTLKGLDRALNGQ